MVINMKIIICSLRTSSLLVLLLANTFSYAQDENIPNDEPVFLKSTPISLISGKIRPTAVVDERLAIKVDQEGSREERALILEVAKKRLKKVELNSSDNSAQPFNRQPATGVLIIDSAVFKDISENFYGIKGSFRLGNYQYELVEGDLSSSINSSISLSRVRRDVPLKLVYFKQNNQYMITDGGLIVSFEKSIDKNIFASEYGLNLKYDFGKVASFKPVPFDAIVNLMEVLKTDSRVSNVELDLIDPYLKEQ